MTSVAAVSVLATAAGCGAGGPAAADGKLAVVATTAPVADFARAVGGAKVSVTQILKPNVDPHDYDPSPADIAAIGAAKVVVSNGVGLESWLAESIKAAGFSGTPVDTSKGVKLRKGSHDEHAHEEEAANKSSAAPKEEEHEHGQFDPHIWHNPKNAQIMATNIERAFSAADSANAATYKKNLAAYVKKLTDLDAATAAKINTIPPANRKLVTNHDAFGYFIDRYRLVYVGSIIPSFDTSAELSGKEIADIVAKIKNTKTPAIFSESSLPPKTAQTIARQAGVKVVAGEDSLYGDALGPAGSAGATYLGAEQHNADVIINALKG